jgi:para-aminobenzoate synthetase component 1
MNKGRYILFKDRRSVQELFSPFASDEKSFLLESSLDVAGMGRYSFFGSRPFATLSFGLGRVRIEEEGRVRTCSEAPLGVLKEMLARYELKDPLRPWPFLCGAVGFLSYDFGFSLEHFAKRHKTLDRVPELCFSFYDSVVAKDHRTGEVLVFSSGWPESGPSRARRARERVEDICRRLSKSVAPVVPVAPEFIDPRAVVSNFSKAAYLEALRCVKAHIAAGDIYQLNLSQKFTARASVDSWPLYRRLVEKFPVAFSAFFRQKDFSILSVSPELFLSCRKDLVTTRPMKGTRPRTGVAARDRLLKKELWSSAKEKAELLMVVDLERNDLGRVCDYRSIKVSHARMIEAYRNVFQVTAQVQGRLHRTKDRVDLLRASFPGGSVTGCPKIRAMEIIERLEPHDRGIYTGSLGYLSFHDTMAFNILIRSIFQEKDRLSFGVGGGIVADSVPSAEYEETLVKARALMQALTGRP